MTQRTQRIVKMSAIALAVLIVVYSIARFAVLTPASNLDKDEARLRDELEQLDQFNSLAGPRGRILNKIAAQTFGLNKLEVSEEIRARLDEMVAASGMRRSKTASAPVTGSGGRDAYDEIGWSYVLEGSLGQAVNMLYLLQVDPYLHHLEGLSIKPMGDNHEVRLSFRYMTIVIEPGKGEELVTGKEKGLQPIASLDDSSGRRDYDLVIARNLFRPYIQKRPEQPRPPVQTVETPPTEAPPAPAPEQSRFRVASLSRFGDEQEISIVDMESSSVRQYNVGDKVGGGTIVLVDHRTLPQHRQPELTADSRLVLRIGQDYYAVDINTSLADRYRLRGKALPDSLKPTGQNATDQSRKTPEAPPAQTAG